MTGRGKYYGRWRRLGERLEAGFYQQNWASRLAYAMKLQGQLYIDRRDFYLPLPPGMHIKLAFISDLHAGPLTDPRVFELAVDAINAYSPDVIFFGGDYVSLHEKHIKQLTDRLKLLAADAQKFAVMGNHDLWLDDQHITSELEKVGIKVLVNAHHPLAACDGISVCGLDEPGVGEPDAAAMFAGAADVRLVLMHSPLGLKHITHHPYHIAFCGHTHGGQIATPAGRALLLPPGSGERRYANGLFALPQERYLLTSKGIGMSDVPVRLFATSEVHLCCLRSQCDTGLAFD